jgi:DNA topoisomerase IB
MAKVSELKTIVDPKDAGIRRRKSGKGFTYTRADGHGRSAA